MEVISSVLVPIVSLRFFAMSLICDSVTWKGLSSSQRFNSSMPSRTLSERVSRLSITCQTTNQPTSPMMTKPSTAVTAVARPRGSPYRRRRTTVGWSSAVTSRAATKASTTSWTALMTRIRIQSVPASTSSRHPASAATRIPQGIEATGSGRGATAGRTRAAREPAPPRRRRSSRWGDGVSRHTRAPPPRRRLAPDVRPGGRRGPSVRPRRDRANRAVSTCVVPLPHG